MSVDPSIRSGDLLLLDALRAIVGHVAHDLNNHLATILGKCEIGLMLDDPARWRRALEESLAAGQSARVLIADLQRVAGWDRLEDTAVPVTDVAAVALRVAGRALGRVGLEIALDQSGTAGTIVRPGALAVALAALLRDLPSVQPQGAVGGRGVLRIAGAAESWRLELELGGPAVVPPDGHAVLTEANALVARYGRSFVVDGPSRLALVVSGGPPPAV